MLGSFSKIPPALAGHYALLDGVLAGATAINGAQDCYPLAEVSRESCDKLVAVVVENINRFVDTVYACELDWLLALKSVNPGSARWGAYRGTSYAEIVTFAVRDIFYMFSTPDEFREYQETNHVPTLQAQSTFEYYKSRADWHFPRVTTLQLRNSAKADPVELGALVRSEFAAYALHSLRTSRPKPPAGSDDGPFKPGHFRFGGKVAMVTGKAFHVAKFLWSRPNRTADTNEVALAVWGDEEKAGKALDGARDRFNAACLNAQVPASLSIDRPDITLTVGDE